MSTNNKRKKSATIAILLGLLAIIVSMFTCAMTIILPNLDFDRNRDYYGPPQEMQPYNPDMGGPELLPFDPDMEFDNMLIPVEPNLENDVMLIPVEPDLEIIPGWFVECLPESECVQPIGD